MPAFTTAHAIQYPLAADRVKDSAFESKLAEDLKALAVSADAAVAGVKQLRGTMTAGTNIDDMRTTAFDGDWIITDNAAFDSLLGTKPPVRSPGRFSFSALGPNMGVAAFQEYRYWLGSDKGVARRTYSPLSPGVGWSAWMIEVERNPADVIDTTVEPSAQGIHKEQLHKAKGVIGTAGKAAVCVRLDHGFNAFQANILALVDQYEIPVTFAVMAPTIGLAGTESSNVSWATLNDWAINRGYEMANHSTSHGDATTNAALTAAIVGNLDSMKASMPEIAIPAFIQPGVSGTQWDGFNNATTAAVYSTKDAGRIILSAHGIATGNLPGPTVELDGVIKQGTAPYSLDLTSQVLVSEAAINDAIESGSGLTVYAHPSLIGVGSNTSLARLEQFFQFLAAKVAAGQVVLLTQSGLAVADASTSRRSDLATPTRWATAAGVTSQTVDLAAKKWAAGHTRSLEVSVTATAAAVVKLAATAGATLNASRSWNVAAGQTVKLRLPFTVPASATSLAASITQTSGAITVSDPVIVSI